MPGCWLLNRPWVWSTPSFTGLAKRRLKYPGTNPITSQATNTHKCWQTCMGSLTITLHSPTLAFSCYPRPQPTYSSDQCTSHSQQLKIRLKLAAEYESVQHLVAPAPAPGATAGPGADPTNSSGTGASSSQARTESRSATAKLIDSVASQPRKPAAAGAAEQSLVVSP